MPAKGSARLRRRIGLAALPVVVGLAGCGSGSSDEATGPASTTAAAELPRISLEDLKACPERKPEGLRCGRIELPLERAEPGGGTISIRFGILPAEQDGNDPRKAIMAVEGGPGYGSIGSANSYSKLFGDLLRDRDLVMVDMRGTAGSEPIDCRDLQRGKGPQLLDLATCARQLGDDYESYRTAAAADDLDDVRSALGYETVSMYGDSYGTYLAQSYAFRHGENLDALVLDSAYPVRGESPWSPSVWRTGIRALTTTCDHSPKCPPGAGERLERMVEKLRRELLGVGPLLYAIGIAGNSPPGSYLHIDGVIERYLEGVRRPYERLAKQGKKSYGDPEVYSVGQELAISCNDYAMIWDKAASQEQRQEQLQERIRSYPSDAFAPFTPREIALSSDVSYVECMSWPQPGPNYEPPAEESAPKPDMPVLVVAGGLDNVTSPAEARLVADDFADAALYIAQGAGHVSSLYDPDVPEAREIRRFLRDPEG